MSASDSAKRFSLQAALTVGVAFRGPFTTSSVRRAFRAGQVFYKASRKLILKGVDGVVFVVDSQTARIEANVEALEDLGDNLREHGESLRGIPCVVQYNKRDLPEIEPVSRLRVLLNPMGAPEVESSANQGIGVMETLQTAARGVLLRMNRKVA